MKLCKIWVNVSEVSEDNAIYLTLETDAIF